MANKRRTLEFQGIHLAAALPAKVTALQAPAVTRQSMSTAMATCAADPPVLHGGGRTSHAAVQSTSQSWTWVLGAPFPPERALRRQCALNCLVCQSRQHAALYEPLAHAFLIFLFALSYHAAVRDAVKRCCCDTCASAYTRLPCARRAQLTCLRGTCLAPILY